MLLLQNEQQTIEITKDVAKGDFLYRKIKTLRMESFFGFFEIFAGTLQYPLTVFCYLNILKETIL